MTVPEPTTERAAPSTEDRPRRDVLCGLVVALVAPGALAAACSDGGSGGGGTTNTGGGNTPTGNTPTGGTPTGGGTGGGQALAAVAQVPEGSGLVVDNPSGGKLVLVRPSANEVKAYNAACTHQGTTVEPPQNGTMTCPNHGSEFSASDGSVKKGPAAQSLPEIPVKVEGTNIVLA